MKTTEFFTQLSKYFRSRNKAEKWADEHGCDLASIDFEKLKTYNDVVMIIVDLNQKANNKKDLTTI